MLKCGIVEWRQCAEMWDCRVEAVCRDVGLSTGGSVLRREIVDWRQCGEIVDWRQCAETWVFRVEAVC